MCFVFLLLFLCSQHRKLIQTENDILVLLYTALNAPMTNIWMVVVYETQMELHLKSIFSSCRIRI